MKDRVIRALAAYGALILVLQAVTLALNLTVNRRLSGIVLQGENQGISNVPVFLDDGAGPRAVRTDSAGAFRIDIEPARLARARLLICAPGARPMYFEEQLLNNLTPTRYFIQPLEPNARALDYARGWRMLVNVECRGQTGGAA